jgi:hypothetical protein
MAEASGNRRNHGEPVGFLSWLFCFALLLSSILPCSAQTGIYTTGVRYTAPFLSAWTQPNTSGDGAELILAISPSNVLSATNYSVGIGHVWYSVQPGTILNTSWASTATPFANAITGDLSGRISLTLGQPFLLGFWLDATSNPAPAAGDRFGWAELMLTTSGLQLIRSATEPSGMGLVAGTTTVVPEPTTLGLAAVALLAFVLVRNCRSSMGRRSS